MGYSFDNNRRNLILLRQNVLNEETPSFTTQKEFFDFLLRFFDDSYYKNAGFEIPNDTLLDETISYVITKNPNYLRKFDKSRLTYDLCYSALLNCTKNPGFLLIGVPKEFLTKDFCIMVVKRFPNLITKIPTNIVTKEFIDELKKYDVNILKYMKYINDCIAMNENSIEENETIDLYELSPFISTVSLRLLESKGITTFNQLNSLFEQDLLAKVIGEKSSLLPEITYKTILLRTKYLNIDPNIDETAETPFSDTLTRLGANTRTIHGFLRNIRLATENITNADFFKLVREGSFISKFSGIRDVGQKSLEELITGAKIVIDYHDNNVVVEINDSKEAKDRLTELSSELSRLIKEKEELDAKITSVLHDIESTLKSDDSIKRSLS